MHIDRWKTPDGGYLDDDGVSYDTALEVLQLKYLDSCMYGKAEMNVRYVRDGLAHLDKWVPRERQWEMSSSEWIVQARQVFGSDAAAQFFYYWADQMGYAEHGSVIPGWLTQEGERLLEDLNEYLTLPPRR